MSVTAIRARGSFCPADYSSLKSSYSNTSGLKAFKKKGKPAAADQFSQIHFAGMQQLPANVRVFQVDRINYPRPQMVREKWQSLNGEWDFVFDDGNIGLSEAWQLNWPIFQDHPGMYNLKIQVPYPYQSEKAGLHPHERGVHPVMWYKREFEIPEDWKKDPNWGQQELILNFGAVDYKASVWLNGQLAWENHQGGHVPFSFNAKPFLKAEGKNVLVVRAEDPQLLTQARGKQDSSGISRGIDYPDTSGIWQSVWMEPVHKAHIEEMKVTPIVNGNETALDISIPLRTAVQVATAEVIALDGDQVITAKEVPKQIGGVQMRLDIPNAKLWSPESPNLYNLQIRLKDRDGNILDEAGSYTGLRSIGLENGRFMLNGKPVFIKSVLDQGYWPESLLTAPDGEALKKDVELIKACGFNHARKHQKVEDPRYFYWADKLGLMVFEEMANSRVSTPESDEKLIREWENVVQRDYNHPSLVGWVPGNESWGQYRLRKGDPRQYAVLERLLAVTRRYDMTRPVITNSGWENTENTDIIDIHDYARNQQELLGRYTALLQGGTEFPKNSGSSPQEMFAWNGLAGSDFRQKAVYHGQPVFMGEAGGFQDAQSAPLSYGKYKTPEQFLEQFKDLLEGMKKLKPLLTGFCYTQLTNVFQEKNGVYKFDRTPVVAPEKIKALMDGLNGVSQGPLLPLFQRFARKPAEQAVGQ